MLLLLWCLPFMIMSGAYDTFCAKRGIDAAKGARLDGGAQAPVAITQVAVGAVEKR
jgi:hypothetical protein